MTDALLYELLAERSIRRLIAAYCDAVSRRDSASAGELFTSDARVVIAGGEPRVGRQAIVDGLERTISNFAYLHQKCDTGLIDVGGETARARIGVMEANRRFGAEKLNVIFGIYEDEYRQVGGSWRFRGREFTLQFQALLPAAELHQFSAFEPKFPVTA